MPLYALGGRALELQPDFLTVRTPCSLVPIERDGWLSPVRCIEEPQRRHAVRCTAAARKLQRARILDQHAQTPKAMKEIVTFC